MGPGCARDRQQEYLQRRLLPSPCLCLCHFCASFGSCGSLLQYMRIVTQCEQVQRAQQLARSTDKNRGARATATGTCGGGCPSASSAVVTAVAPGASAAAAAAVSYSIQACNVGSWRRASRVGARETQQQEQQEYLQRRLRLCSCLCLCLSCGRCVVLRGLGSRPGLRTSA